MKRETLRVDEIPATQCGESDFVVTLWTEGGALGLDVDRDGEELYSGSGFRAGAATCEDSIEALVSFCHLAAHDASHDEDDARLDEVPDWVESFEDAVRDWRTVEHFEQGAGNRSHLRRVWFREDGTGCLNGDFKRDGSAIFLNDGQEAQEMLEELQGACADPTEDEPMESLRRGWTVPFWVHEDLLAALLRVEL